jgi:hypothetical protein
MAIFNKFDRACQSGKPLVFHLSETQQTLFAPWTAWDNFFMKKGPTNQKGFREKSLNP